MSNNTDVTPEELVGLGAGTLPPEVRADVEARIRHAGALRELQAASAAAARISAAPEPPSASELVEYGMLKGRVLGPAEQARCAEIGRKLRADADYRGAAAAAKEARDKVRASALTLQRSQATRTAHEQTLAAAKAKDDAVRAAEAAEAARIAEIDRRHRRATQRLEAAASRASGTPAPRLAAEEQLAETGRASVADGQRK